MTGNDIVQGLRAEVVEPNPAFFTNATLLYWINRAQADYVRRVRCLQSYAFMTSVQGQKTYPVPANWLASEKVFWNNPQPNSGIAQWGPVKPTSLEKMAQENPNWLSDDPSMWGRIQVYFIQNKTLFLYPANILPTPNDIFMFYEAKPTPLLTLDDSISIDDSLVSGIEAYCLWKMWKMDQEDQLAEEQRIRYEGQTPGGSGGEIGLGLKWKKQKVLDGKWKIDIESYMPYNYSSVNGSAFNNQINPLNI
jgi:hypothetical protein